MITDTMSDTEWQTQHFHRVFLPKANTNASSLCSYLGWKIFTITNDDTMYFNSSYLQRERLELFLTGIKATRLSNIYLSDYSYPALVNDLSQIVFSNLIVLQLSGNKISSIEALRKIETGKVRILLLANNHITTIKTLTKTDLQSLQVLSLNKNYIKQISSHLVLLNSPNLTKIQSRENRCRSGGFQAIAKLQSNEIECIDQCLSRILFPRTKQTMMALLTKFLKLDKYIYS